MDFFASPPEEDPGNPCGLSERSSAIPLAIFAIKLAVHGITTIASEFDANFI